MDAIIKEILMYVIIIMSFFILLPLIIVIVPLALMSVIIQTMTEDTDEDQSHY